MNETYLVFTIDSNQYAINSSFVQMIVQKTHITKVPMLPNHVLGYINYGSKPIPLIDINVKFNKVESEILDNTCFIVINNSSECAIVSDSVDKILDINDTEIKPFNKKLFNGIYSEGVNNILLIDINQLN